LKIRNQRDFGAGVMYIVVGIFFSSIATHYRMGTTAQMGPGYFPFWLGALLSLIGLILTFSSISKKTNAEKIPKCDFKIVLWITGSILLYAVLLPTLGFIFAIFVLVFVSSSVSHEFGWKGTLVNATVLVIFTYLAFVVGLSLTFPLWPIFIN
jgi:hypothetical protein